MPGPTTIAEGNVKNSWLLAVTLSPVSVAANTTAEQAFTVAGLQVGDFVDVNKPSVQAGLGIVNSRVSAANTLQIGFVNATGSPITPTAAETYALNVTRADNLPPSGPPLLTQIT